MTSKDKTLNCFILNYDQMPDSHALYFTHFKLAINDLAVPFFHQLGFDTGSPFKEEAEWISIAFFKNRAELVFSLSLHHLDYQDGIQVRFKINDEIKYLSAEVQKHKKSATPVYPIGENSLAPVFKQIPEDFMLCFGKYIEHVK